MKLKHLPHLEDRIFFGREGFNDAFHTLLELHRGLGGRKKISITTKMDGAPSVVFGYHPTNEKFFVATKSAWNKNPVLNYSISDIQANYSSQPDLADKLRMAYLYLRKVTAYGLFQADILYTGIDKNRYDFTANTITYSTQEDQHLEQMQKARIGICVHTQYRGYDWDNLMMEFDVDRFAFNYQHQDVHFVDPTVDVMKVCYQYYDQQKIMDLLDSANEAINLVKDDWATKFNGHSGHLIEYVNHCIKLPEWTYPNEAGFKDFLVTKKSPDTLKTYLQIKDPNLWNIFYAHQHLTLAKNKMISLLNTQTMFDHHIHGTRSEPEGYVMHYKGIPSKLIKRLEFSRMNQLSGRFRTIPEAVLA